MPKKLHSNSLDNPNVHHLYCIYDFEKREIYKFGISDKPIINDRSSVRLMEQITLYNKVTGSKRFSGRILIRSIKGRRFARQAEDNIILKFKHKYGRFPRGNEGHKFLKEL